MGVAGGPGVLWLALPLVVALVGLTPPASLAASQAAFTLMLLVLFALVEPTGVDVGLLRLGDVALGGAVSVLVAAALWPRGAGGALRGRPERPWSSRPPTCTAR